jgi:hypothetical protein
MARRARTNLKLVGELMDEAEFDSLMQSRPFGREDAMRADAALRHHSTLGLALWGQTSADLQRQLKERRSSAVSRTTGRSAEVLREGSGIKSTSQRVPGSQSAHILRIPGMSKEILIHH